MEKQPGSPQKAPQNDASIGLTQILIGVGTILVATFAVRFTVLIVGIVLAARGALDLFHAFRAEGKKPAGVMAIGILSLATGILVLAWPKIGASVLSLALAALFIVGGGQKALAPLMEKRATDRTQVVLGLISVLLGIVIFASWPINSFGILGILVGIEILLNGMTMAVAGKAVHKFGQDFRPTPQH